MVVLTEKKGKVGWITLNRPEALNGINEELADAAVAAFAQMEADSDVNVIVFTGAGKAFCAGGDLKAIMALDSEEVAQAFVAKAGSITDAIYNCKKPVIGMINGVAAGAGFNLALACDILFTANTVKFIQSFSNVALVPDCGGHFFLPRAIGSWLAKEAMFEASPVTAIAAKEHYGFVNQIYASEELLEETTKYADYLASKAPLSLQNCKALVNKSGTMTLAEILKAEAEIQGKLVMSDDCKEGLNAFFEKRAPEFTGK